MESERPTVNELQPKIDAYRESLWTSEAIKLGKFTLRSGSESCVYVDHGDMLCNPDSNEAFMDAMTGFLQNFVQESALANLIVANVASKSSPQTTGVVARELKYRQIALLPENVAEVEQGTNRDTRLPDHIQGNETIVIVDDVGTTGETAIKAKEKILMALQKQRGMTEEELKGLHFHLVVGLARNPEKLITNLSEQGINLHYVTNLYDLLSPRWQQIPTEYRAGIKKEFPQFEHLEN